MQWTFFSLHYELKLEEGRLNKNVSWNVVLMILLIMVNSQFVFQLWEICGQMHKPETQVYTLFFI